MLKFLCNFAATDYAIELQHASERRRNSALFQAETNTLTLVMTALLSALAALLPLLPVALYDRVHAEAKIGLAIAVFVAALVPTRKAVAPIRRDPGRYNRTVREHERWAHWLTHFGLFELALSSAWMSGLIMGARRYADISGEALPRLAGVTLAAFALLLLIDAVLFWLSGWARRSSPQTGARASFGRVLAPSLRHAAVLLVACWIQYVVHVDRTPQWVLSILLALILVTWMMLLARDALVVRYGGRNGFA